eukprot:TRINITY_DN13943_c0_g2_i2.p1 TRINITY_DN13943_c0_g2~~TRINITY_DN13943_c0_g2_i2.p1  ORF type:complete len:462 (+),score=85.80 TRINITY_DN13943_c0_g2_i2:129-1388(+)
MAIEDVRSAIVAECGLQNETLTVALSSVAVRPGNTTGQMQEAKPSGRVKANFSIEQVVDSNLDHAMTLAEQLLGKVRFLSRMQLAKAITWRIQQRGAWSSNYSVHVPFLSTVNPMVVTTMTTTLAPTSMETAIVLNAKAGLSVSDANDFVRDPNAAAGVQNAILEAIALPEIRVSVELSLVRQGTSDNSTSARVNAAISLTTSRKANMPEAQAFGVSLVQKLGSLDKPSLAALIALKIRSIAASKNETQLDHLVQVHFLSPTEAISKTGSTAITLNANAELSVPDPEAFSADPIAIEGVRSAIATQCGLQSETLTVGLSIVAVGFGNTTWQMQGAESSKRVKANFTVQKLVDGNLTQAMTLAEQLLEIVGRMNSTELASSIMGQMQRRNASSANYSVHVPFLSTGSVFASSPSQSQRSS